MLGHYLNHWDGGEYGRELVDGDVHGLTADRLDCTRQQAKTFAYATLYGASPRGKSANKMATDMGKPVKWVGRMLTRFAESVPGLQELTAALNAACRPHPKNRSLSCIRALDGYPLVVRSKHAVINTLLQSAGALCAKKWAVEVDAMLPHGVYIMAHVHDEMQISCPESLVDEVARVVEDATDAVTAHFGLHVPLASECVVGRSWQETH